jgi:hypothetical protein
MRENTRGYRRKTVNLHVELVSDVICQLNMAEFPQLEQPWYADDAEGAGTTFDKIEGIFQWLWCCKVGPLFGYYSQTHQKHLHCAPQHNIKAAWLCFLTSQS